MRTVSASYLCGAHCHGGLMKTLREKFGEKVRVLRKAKGLTQEQLGRQAKLHHTYIGAIERAECNLSMDNIEKIAKALGIDTAELFTFSSRLTAVSAVDRMLIEISGALKNSDEKSLAHVQAIIREALELAGKG